MYTVCDNIILILLFINFYFYLLVKYQVKELSPQSVSCVNITNNQYIIVIYIMMAKAVFYSVPILIYS